MACPYNFDDVGVLQEKLASFTMKLTIHQVQDSEKQKVDKGAKWSTCGPSCHRIPSIEPIHKWQCMNCSIAWGLCTDLPSIGLAKKFIWVFFHTMLRKSLNELFGQQNFWWPIVTRNIQRKEFWDIQIHLGNWIYYKATTVFKIGFITFLHTLPGKSALSNPSYFRITITILLVV